MQKFGNWESILWAHNLITNKKVELFHLGIFRRTSPKVELFHLGIFRQNSLDIVWTVGYFGNFGYFILPHESYYAYVFIT